MADIKAKYPSTSSLALAITLASLASDASLLAGVASTAVDNTTNVDLDHLLSGFLATGTSPTANTQIEVWAWASFRTAAGVPTYPDSITGTNAAKTMTSMNVKLAALRPVAVLTVDNTSNRKYPFAPVSIAQIFGAMPKFWGVFIVHNTGVALDPTGTNFVLDYERIQAQTV